MAKRKLVKLKAAMYESDITQADIAKAIGRCATYVGSRMTGRESFTLEDVRKIGTLLQIDRAQWLDYFMEGA